MDAMNQQRERELQRLLANQVELVERIKRLVREDGVIEPLKGLHLARVSKPLVPQQNENAW